MSEQRAALAGSAYGAVTILNATATGIGCSLAIDRATRAWWDDDAQGQATGPLVDAVRSLVPSAAAMHAHVDCPTPPERGLKTSASVAIALLRAAGAREDDLAANAVQAQRLAGATVTGALDDVAACARGGAHLTDARAGRILRSLPAKAWHVAVWQPEARIPKTVARGLDAAPLAARLEMARGLAECGDLPAAMTANGRAFTQFYREHGLPIHEEPARVALAAGALGAGLSGTGPAVAALFDEPVALRPVDGGVWCWARAVPA